MEDNLQTLENKKKTIPYIQEEYDVVVVGAGHAGCEAALACARLGLETIMFTVSVDSIAMMPCNPNIGGSSKGHLVSSFHIDLPNFWRAPVDNDIMKVRSLTWQSIWCHRRMETNVVCVLRRHRWESPVMTAGAQKYIRNICWM